MTVGLEGSFVTTYYDMNVLNDSDTYSIGAFLETQLTSNLKFRLAGGYQSIDFDNTGLVNDPHDAEDFYANLLISHRVNAQLTQNLALGHETQLGVNSNYIQLNYIRHTTTWNILLKTLLSTELFYEDADDSGGSGPLFNDRYRGFRISIHSSRSTSIVTAARSHSAISSLRTSPSDFVTNTHRKTRISRCAITGKIASESMAPTASNKETIEIA